MSRLIDAIKWGATLGGGEQNFLGAGWVTTVLNYTPDSKRRAVALKLLSLSPHYFLDRDDPKYAGISQSAYLQDAFAVCRESREKIFDQILTGRIFENDTVLDYGCGPGFLARVIAKNAAKVYACDISTGALECARILNAADHLTYVVADEVGLSTIADGSIDVAISFALVQHISDEIYDLVLANIAKKLKSGGRLVLHVQLIEPGWSTEDEWRSDKSVKGRIKYKYGLHCFARDASHHDEMVEKHGFENINVEAVANLVTERFDDVCDQHLLFATRV